MSAVVTGIAVGAYGANQQRVAASRASDAQQAAADRAMGLQSQQYQQSREDMAPWLKAGKAGLAEQQALMGMGGDTAGAMRSLQSSPGYQFRQQQGLRNLEGGLAARGGMGSGKGMAAGQQYSQNFASNEYGNRLSQLSGLSSSGQNAAAGQGQMGMQYAGNMGNLMTGAANAYGAGQIAQANATQQGLVGGAQLGLAGYSAMNQPKYGDVPQQYPAPVSSNYNWGK